MSRSAPNRQLAYHNYGDALRLAMLQVAHFQRLGIPLDPDTVAVLPGAEIVLWAQNRDLTPEGIAERWGISRATSFRWLRLLQQEKFIPARPRPSGKPTLAPDWPPPGVDPLLLIGTPEWKGQA